MKPEIKVGTTILRPSHIGDADCVRDVLHDPDVRRYLCDDRLLPDDAILDLLHSSDRLDGQELGLWVIEHDGVACVGIAGLQPVSPEVAVSPVMVDGIEPLIALRSAYWGAGIASAVLGALLDHARVNCGVTRLVAAVDRPNTRSHVLMRRLGFSETGAAQGPRYELVLYRML